MKQIFFQCLLVFLKSNVKVFYAINFFHYCIEFICCVCKINKYKYNIQVTHTSFISRDFAQGFTAPKFSACISTPSQLQRFLYLPPCTSTLKRKCSAAHIKWPVSESPMPIGVPWLKLRYRTWILKSLAGLSFASKI